MSWVVIAVLAVVWTAFLVPRVVGGRRRREDPVGPSATVVVEGQSAWAGLVVLGGAAALLALVAVADHDLVLGLAAVGCAVLLPRLWRQRDSGPAAVADSGGIRLRFGQLRWEEVGALVRVGSAHYVLASPGAPPADAGWFGNAFLRLDRGVTGLPVWGGVPAEVAAVAAERGVPVVEPATRGAWWVARAVFWVLG